MSDPTFTILLPIHRPPAMLPRAIDSVLAQERQDFELFVICDGAPPETAACARDFAARDSRIRAFVHPKGERHGEAYRHQALQNARGIHVCQIGDDDLWFPNHLTEMAALLHAVDFGNLSHVEIRANGRVVLLPGDLDDAAVRERMLGSPFNFFGPTVAGYRLSAYRSLPQGWSPAPTDLPTDLYMWRKFLAREDLRFGTRVAVTAVKFGAHSRRDWPIERRANEVEEWAARVSVLSGRDSIVQMALRGLNRSSYAASTGRDIAALRAQLKARAQQISNLRQRVTRMKRTWSWRITRPLRKAARLLGR